MYVLLILAAFMIQNNLFAAISWIDITPNLLLIVTFVFGFIRGRVHGMIIGFFCGLLSDLFFGTNIGFYALIYTALGYGNGIIGHLFYTEFLHLPVVLCILNELVFSFYVFVFLFLIKGSGSLGHYFVSIILPEIVYTVIVTIILYKPLQLLDKWVDKISVRSTRKFV